MKLYGCNGTCSLAPHIVLHEFNIDHEYVHIDLRAGEGQSPEFLEINPLGQVPTLIGEHGEVMTEVSSILLYLFQQFGEMDVPMYQSVRHLSFISTELHRSFYPIFFGKRIVDSEEAAAQMGEHFKKRLRKRWEYVDYLLPAFDDLDGVKMGPADPYLYTVCRWWISAGGTFDEHASIIAFLKNMESRESVQEALKHEGLETVSAQAVSA